MSDSCDHERTRPGELAPRRYGTYRTVVCVDCGAFQCRTHLDELAIDWRPAQEYRDAVRDQELP